MENQFEYPHIKQSLSNFLYDEEGNIPRSKVLMVGAMVIVLSLMMVQDVYASHSSHRSHSSHSSHTSGDSGGGHASHASSTTTHSNNPVTTPAPTPHSNHSNIAPSIAEVNRVSTPFSSSEITRSNPQIDTHISNDSLPDVDILFQKVPHTPIIK